MNLIHLIIDVELRVIFFLFFFHLDVRLKFVTILMFVVLCIGITITILRFGVGALEDNFVSQLSTTYSSSAEFLAFYGLLNIYLFTSAYVYSPSDRALLGMYIT